MRYAVILLFPALLAACEEAKGPSPTAGGLSAGEAQALDEAAEMIEQRRLPAEAIREPAVAATGQHSGEPAR